MTTQYDVTIPPAGSGASKARGVLTERNAKDDAGTLVFEGRAMEAWKLHRRWDRAGRLLGEDAMRSLYDAHVMVFGLGGVGSFTAESLARSGVGKLTLADFDRVCGTNTNRQLHAMKGTFGKFKSDLMAERCSLINPEGTVIGRRAFYHASTSEEFFSDRPDFVVDAIDNVTAKVHLLKTCLELGIPVVSSMGAAGKVDPTQIRLADLNDTHGDPLARSMRKIMRQQEIIPASGPTGIMCVYSPEPRNMPRSLSYDGTEGFKCICPTKGNDLNSCDQKNLVEGTVSFVTGVFGMMAASVVVRAISEI